jgi:hypothetical protein
MKLIALLPLLGLGIMGCNSEHGMHYDLLLDTSLSTEQVQDVLAAEEAWETAVPGLTFSTTITPCQGYEDKKHTVCLFLDSSDPAELAAGHAANALATTIWQHNLLASDTSASADSATVHLWSSNIAGYPGEYAFRNICQHEIGHSLSHRSDHLAEGNLMQPESARDILENIETGDVDYFWSVR